MKDDDFIADLLTDAAVDYIAGHAAKPFFLMLSHYAVHTPIKGKPADIELFRSAPTSDHDNPVYAALLKSVDDSVGRVVEALRRAGVEHNTAIIFTSDNGGLTPVTSNYPLLGGKSLGYEAGLRVPWIVKWPGTVKPGNPRGHAGDSDRPLSNAARDGGRHAESAAATGRRQPDAVARRARGRRRTARCSSTIRITRATPARSPR